MKKFIIICFQLLILAIFMPVIKPFYDQYTAPLTGTMVLAGDPEWKIAIVGAVPWVFPLGIFIWMIITLAKGRGSPDQYGGQR